MTARERQASGGVGLAQRPPAPRPSLTAPTALAPLPPPSWADLFHSLTGEQHREVLELAERQGVVYGHQLPPADAAPRRSPLAALLAGRQPDLPSVTITPRPLHDSALDLYQQQAVWRALQSPDVCLIHGTAGTGKSRVAAEIVRQAAEQRQRVLLVAPCAAGLDQVLQRVHDHPEILALRCLHANETAAHLPRAIHALTLSERVRHLREDALQAARAAEEAATKQVQDLQTSLAKVELWETLQGRSAEVAKQQDALKARLTNVVVENDTAEMQAVQAQRDQERQKQRGQRSEIEQKQRDLDQRRAPVEQECADLGQLVQAKQHGQWWTGAWWRATLQGQALKRHEEVAAQLQQFDAEAQQIKDKLAAIDAEAARQEAEFNDKLATLRQHEVERLRGEWTAQLQQFASELGTLAATSEQLRALFGAESPAAQRERWTAELAEARQRLDFAQRWTHGLEAAGVTWTERIAQLANVVATTVSALAADPHFGDKVATPPTFDLLLVEEAEQLTEADFQVLARRCTRWVLLGEVPPDHDAAQRPALNKANRSSIVRPGTFQRLWQQLHCDPRRLPVRWERRGDRLCCRLRPIAPDQERWAEREPVLDRSDVELTIVSPPRVAPILAEVSFPATTPLDEAKRFIFGEVQELSVQSAAHGCHWTEEGSCLRLHLGSHPASGDVPVPLAEGVTEWVRAEENRTPHTVALDFCSDKGWHRSRAEEWLRAQCSLRDSGRTMALPRVHRLHPDLSAIVHDLQGEPSAATECKDVVPTWAGWNAPLVFVPVPSPRNGPRRSNNGTTQPRTRFEARGAGLEYDLEDTAHPPHVPHELRQQLPKHGLVNWLEAEAVVRAVEGLVQDAAFRRDCSTPLGVTALYVAQVKLIHLLLLASPVLQRENVQVIGPDDQESARTGGLCVEVNLPSAWKQRECASMLVSLTRSHSHRAVAFGEQPAWLPATLTRARTRLVLFGDPGTLARRAQWQGALDRLDEVTATRERDFVAQLVQYLQGHGLHSDRFQLYEGSSA